MIRHTVTHQGHAYEILEVGRSDWGATIDAGYPLNPATVRNWGLHHTVGPCPRADSIDELLDEVIAATRQLETVHTSLAPPGVPYSWLPYKGMHDRQCLLVEGRGSHRTGAHTACNNSTTLAWSLPGNYEGEQVTPAQIVAMRFVAARDTPHVTGRALGHQQYPYCPMPGGGNYHATACPGKWGLAVLDQLQPPYALPTPPTPKGWDEMATKDEVKDALREVLREREFDLDTIRAHLLPSAASASKPPARPMQTALGAVADKLGA